MEPSAEPSQPVAGALMVDRIQRMNEGGERFDLHPSDKICDVLSNNDEVFLSLRASIKVSTAQMFVRSEWAANAFSSGGKGDDVDSNP